MAGQMESVRRCYGVPAHKGRYVTFLGYAVPIKGRIISSTGSHLYIRRDGAPKERIGPLHPTWKMDYHDGRGDLSRQPTPMDRAWSAASPSQQETTP